MKNILIFSVFTVVSLVAWSGYAYFFDKDQPQLTVAGLRDGEYCSGDVQCIVASNKKGDVALWLDGNSIVTKFKMGQKNQKQSFPIPTRTIANGKHDLKIEFTDSTFNQNRTVQELAFYVDNVPLQAAFVKPDTDLKVLQGRTLHMQFQVNKGVEGAQVHALANTFDCFPESKDSLIYECFVPISCEEKASEYLLSVDVTDKVGNKLRLDNKFQVIAYPFQKQHLHIEASKIKEEREQGLDDKEFNEAVESIVKNSPNEKLWRGTFCAPIDIQRVTCEFGTIRTTQHKGRYAHKALDVINLPKSVVWATQDGVVAMKDRFASSGNTVIIDHGCGIISMFYHLDEFANINVGDKIAKGNPVGTLGKTGYAKGYHLHWEMRIKDTPIDPMQWTRSTF